MSSAFFVLSKYCLQLILLQKSFLVFLNWFRIIEDENLNSYVNWFFHPPQVFRKQCSRQPKPSEMDCIFLMMYFCHCVSVPPWHLNIWSHGIYLCPGVVSEPEGQVETSREDGHQHHEAARFPYAILQSFPDATKRGASGQPDAPRSLAHLTYFQCHTNAYHPRVHGLTSGPAANLFQPQLSQHPTWHGPKYAAHGPTSLPVPTQLQRQIPNGGRQEFQHRSAQDEGQRAPSVDG